VVLDDGTKIDAISVILAVGRERRKLALPKEEDWTGNGVSYCSTCDAPLYRNKAAAGVVGGGNAAVEGAVLLAKYAKNVFLIYRRDELTRPEPILLKVLDQTDNVKVLYSTEVVELLGSDQAGLTGVRLSKPWEGQDELVLDGLFVEAGADPRLEIPNQLGLEINPDTGEVHVDRALKTSVEGIYAAGDLTDGTDLKQTITAASQGAIAALSAYQHVQEIKAGRQDAVQASPAAVSGS
jgi:thioredoxin reductase (NADPH)